MDREYYPKCFDAIELKSSNAIAIINVKLITSIYNENILSETANIRTNNKEYFQILILPEEMPYYNKKGKIIKWERVTNHNIDKYIALSRDNTEKYLHTPIKTLLFIIRFPGCDHNAITKKSEYARYYLNQVRDIHMRISAGISGSFGNAIVLNDYKMFIEKVAHYIKSI